MNDASIKQSEQNYLAVKAHPLSLSIEKREAAGAVVCEYENELMTIKELRYKIDRETIARMDFDKHTALSVRNLHRAGRKLTAVQEEALWRFSQYWFRECDEHCLSELDREERAIIFRIFREI